MVRKTQFEIDWADKLMVHDYPECGPGSIQVETLYQAFKERFLDEFHSKMTSGKKGRGIPMTEYGGE